MKSPEIELPELLALDLDAHFAQLVASYQQGLYVFILRQTGHAQLAEDILQEAFLRAYSTLRNYPAERRRTLKIQAWLYKVALNTFYGHLRQTRVQEISLDLLEDFDQTWQSAWYDQPDIMSEQREWIHTLEEYIACLPLQFRTLVNLYYFEELSHQEIADLLAIPLGTVKSGIYRGTQLLRRALTTQEGEVRSR
ncbi:ECF RNA polymerase sigma factor SigW [Ktedonobacter sp. SOSP1-52]|uniref:RNA polymerase sigma factor n=1 Tax=Ktedonobacter sp. SOSP1-52 TaxID=2778366 RepID=UPI00191663B9|nr:sigma-70 family RNA polymerase sigma factor [Ktedonobacter sp. SOSP1-52]GHO65210.1 ECF RNA polymerase sigma factor SigW [Ktedonobacter sp. SOSP1-52]